MFREILDVIYTSLYFFYKKKNYMIAIYIDRRMYNHI